MSIYLVVYIIVTMVLFALLLKINSLEIFDQVDEDEQKNDPVKYHLKTVMFCLLISLLTPMALIALCIAFSEWLEDTNLTELLAKKQASKELGDSIEVINFRDLSGQELDAELTKIHKEKQGWNN